jgi:hypothetical protein
MMLNLKAKHVVSYDQKSIQADSKAFRAVHEEESTIKVRKVLPPTYQLPKHLVPEALHSRLIPGINEQNGYGQDHSERKLLAAVEPHVVDQGYQQQQRLLS